MPDRLFIEEQEVDLTPETVISITLQVNDLGELVDRQANFTNQFKVPKTSRNRAIFESPELVTSVTTIPYRKLKAKVIKEGIEVVSKGYAIVDSSTSEYNVTVYGGLVDFFRLLEGKKLRDLNLDSYIHAWELNEVYNARTNVDGFIYPIVKYAPSTLQVNGTDYNTDYALPCVFVSTLIEKIVEGTGFTIEGDFLNDEYYRRAIFQVGTDTWVTSGKVLHADTTTDLVDQNPGSPYGGVQLQYEAQDSTSGNPVNRTGAFDILGWWTFSNEYILGQDYNVPAELKLKIHIDLEYWYRGGYPERLKLQLFAGGYVAWAYTTQNLGAGTNYLSFDIELPPGRYLSGSPIKLNIKSLWHPLNDASSLTIKSGSFIEAEVATAPMVLGAPVNLALNLPDMAQVDFFKGIAQLFGLIVIPKSNQGKIEVGSLSIIERNKAIAPDFSDKVHVETDANGNPLYEVYYKVGNYGQKNYFNYTNDDTVTENLGRGIFTIDNEVLEAEKEVLTLPFSGTDYVLDFSWNDRIPYIPRFDANTGLIGEQVGKRILLLDTIVTPDNVVRLVSTVSGSQFINDYLPKARFIDPTYTFNLGFQEGILYTYYDMLKRTLRRAIRLVLKMKLSALDIANLNFLVPVYLKQFSSYFYINRVSNYVASDRLTKVELIRIGTADNVYVAPSYPEILLNPGFTEGFDANNNPGFKYWLTVYRSWFSITNGVQYDYQMGSPDVLIQVLNTVLTVGAVYEFRVTLTNYTTGTLDIYLDLMPSGTFMLIPATTFQYQGNQDYAVQFTATGSEYALALQPSSDFDGALTFFSLKRVL